MPFIHRTVRSYANLEAFFADPPAASRAWVCRINNVEHGGVGQDGMQRLLWSGLRIPLPEIPDSLITLTAGDAAQVTRDGSGNLVLSGDGTQATLDDVEVSFDLLLQPLRFPGSVEAQVRVAGSPAAGNRVGPRISNGTLWGLAALQCSGAGPTWERDAYDSAGNSATAVALSGSPDPTAADCRIIVGVGPRFPQRLTYSTEIWPLDVGANNTALGITPGANNWDLQAASSTVAGARISLNTSVAGSGTLTATVKYLAARTYPGLRDSWTE